MQKIIGLINVVLIVTIKNMNLLKLENLSVKFKSKKSLKDLFKNIELDAVIDTSFTIKKNKTFGIVGESGSGKTTIAKTILGLHTSLIGKLNFNNQEIDLSKKYRDKNFRKDVSMIFQDSAGSLSPRIKVKHLIGEPFRINKINNLNLKNEVNQLIKSVGLSSDFLDRYPHELSGGQAKRICIARAIALKPKLLIADEPTAGLDVSVQGEILNLLKSIQNIHGMSILIISHNLNVIRHITDELTVMYFGKIMERGDSEKIFKSPKHPYTQALISLIKKPDIDRKNQKIELKGEVPSIFERKSGCVFSSRCQNPSQNCKTGKIENKLIKTDEDHWVDQCCINCN